MIQIVAKIVCVWQDLNENIWKIKKPLRLFVAP